MIVKIPNANVSNVWVNEGTDKKTKEVFHWWRALVNVAGEPPLQLAVDANDAEKMAKFIGKTGTALVDIDATPGSRMKVFFRGLE